LHRVPHEKQCSNQLEIPLAPNRREAATNHQFVLMARRLSPENNRLFYVDEFVVMACDGVWDVMANDEACFFLRKSIQEGNRDLGKILEDMEV